jgi:hypothetical protein
MSSIIKVDQIQLSDGSAPTAADLGIDIGETGKVLNVEQLFYNGDVAVSSGSPVKVMERTYTTVAANSKILIDIDFSTGHPGSYTDNDLAVSVGYRTSSSSTITDYTAVPGSKAWTRQHPGIDSVFAIDTHPAGAHGTQYWNWEHKVTRLISPSYPAGTTIYVAVWADTDGTYYFNRPWGSTYSDSGRIAQFTFTEIAG